MRNVIYSGLRQAIIAVAISIWFMPTLVIAAEVEVDAVDPLTGVSEELLAKERRVLEMHEANRREWEQMLQDERKRGEELLKREEEERQRQLQLEIPDTSHVNPLLKKAWTAYRDYENRNRQQIEQMFMEYLEHNPESPLAPEVYYTIGTMYSTNLNRRIGETFTRQKRDHYFRKAVEGYGEQHSRHAYIARSWLVSSIDIPLADRLDRYERVIRLAEELGPKDVHPAEWIERHVLHGNSAVMTQEQIEMQIPDLKRSLRAAIPSIEELILRRVRNPAELKVIAERFPDRQLGLTAKAELKEWLNEQADVDQMIDSDQFWQPTVSIKSDESPIQPTLSHSESTKDQKVVEDRNHIVESPDRRELWLYALGICILCAGAAIAIIKVCRRRSTV